MIELREVTLTFPPPRARSIRERLNGLRRRDGSVEDDRAVTALRDIRLLVPPGDAGALAGALEEIITRPAPARTRAEAATAWIGQTFGTADYWRPFEQLIRKVAGA